MNILSRKNNDYEPQLLVRVVLQQLTSSPLSGLSLGSPRNLIQTPRPKSNLLYDLHRLPREREKEEPRSRPRISELTRVEESYFSLAFQYP